MTAAPRESDGEDPRLIVTDFEPGLRVITLNRPRKRNAIDQAMFAGLLEQFARLDADEEVRAAVITGSDPAFCGGADLAEAADPLVVAERRAGRISPPTSLLGVRTPVLGAINGACVTGGLELALACDFLVASERAVFADTHAQLGMIPAWGAAALLPAAIGARQAKELSLTGRFFDAAEALRLGLVNHVVAHADLLRSALAIASQIAAAPPDRVAGILEIHDAGEGRPHDERLAIERRVLLASAIDVSGAARRREALGASGRPSPAIPPGRGSVS
jgi:enoyl-CoA hydratase